MKRHSMVYAVSLTIIIFTITTFIQNPLEPGEVLAKTLENYQQSGIYHEKILEENFEDNLVSSAYLNETYKDSIGNYLHLTRNPQTDEVELTELTYVSPLGDVQFYSSSDDFDWRQDFTPDQQAWLDTLEGEKIYCIQKVSGEVAYGSAVLLMAAEDHSINQLSGEIVMRQDLNDVEKMVDLNRSQESPETYIKDMIARKSYQYSRVKDGQEAYHLFKMPLFASADSEISFFIDAKNYQLKKYEVHREENGTHRMTRTTILISEHLDESQKEAIFNPNAFDGAQEILPTQGAGAIPFKTETSGCFDHEGQKLEESFFESLPSDLKQAFNQHLEETQAIIDKYDFFSADQFKESEALPFDPKAVQMPSRANLIQGFQEGKNESWLFMADKQAGEDNMVYSPFDGVVSYTQDTGGAYGQVILVDHHIDALDFQTHYSHLFDIKVKSGQAVKKGQILAQMSNTGGVYGFSNKDYLGFELRVGGFKMNPAVLWSGENGTPLIKEMGAKIKAFTDEPSIYKNSEYGFSLTLPETWKAYTVTKRYWGINQEIPSFDLGLPDQESILNISIHSKAQWEQIQAEDGPKPTFLGESEQYVFGYSGAQDYANPEIEERMREIPSILETFKLTAQ